MKFKALILLLFVFNLLKAQNTNILIKRVEKLLIENNVTQFDKVYSSIWKEYIKEQHPNYQKAVEETKNNNFENAFRNIDSIISEDYFMRDILTDKNFEKLHKNKQWKTLENKINNIESKYNQKIRKRLIRLRDSDQSIRLILLYTRQTKPKDTILLKKVRTKMKEIDNESAEIIANIIDKYGWLGKNEIGEQGNQTLFLGIQHIDDLKVQKKYLPILEEALKNGNAEPWHYAFLTDRILMNKGEKQIYGTQVIISSNPENSYVVPLQNPDKVNELRKKVGLEPLEEYLKEMDLKWNLEDYKKDSKRIEELYRKRFEEYKEEK